MSVEAKTAILEHLGRQHEEMVALLAELVDIDSGSYNKRGVDSVGDRLRAHLDAGGISCKSIPNATYADCMAARLPRHRRGQTADRTDGTSRHGISRRHRRRAPVPDRRQPG